MILKSLYKSVSSIPLLCPRQTNALPDRTQIHTLVRVIVHTLAVTAEHYKFCWSLSLNGAQTYAFD
jgi:hypothetical protein